MKKTLLATLLATLAITSSALEVGVTGSSDRSDTNHKDAGIGLSLGQHFGKVSATGEVDYYQKTGITKASVVAGYDVFAFGPATLTAKLGGVYIDQEANQYNTAKTNGLAGLAGAGVSVDVIKNVAVTVDYRYQASTDSDVKKFNGNTYLAGVKYSF
jgi:opacity protein-like surface antigen